MSCGLENMTQTSSYLTAITHVAIQLVDIMRALQKKKSTYCSGDSLSLLSSFFVVVFLHVINSTWLESPVQVSGISQSFTASRHTTPLRSYWITA